MTSEKHKWSPRDEDELNRLIRKKAAALDTARAEVQTVIERYGLENQNSYDLAMLMIKHHEQIVTTLAQFIGKMEE